MRTRTFSVLGIALMLAALLVAACGQAASQQPTAAPNAQPTAAGQPAPTSAPAPYTHTRDRLGT